MRYSALSPRDVACDDRLSVCKGEKVDGLEKAFSAPRPTWQAERDIID